MRKNGWNPGLQYSDFLYLIAAKGGSIIACDKSQ